MMQKLIVEMKQFQETLNSKESIKKLVSYYGDKFYVLIFLKQYERLVVNMKTIGALLEIDSIEDSYTIFRKYIETYSIMMSVYENRTVVKKYMVHDSYIGYKACGEKKDEIKNYVMGKPDGFLEYGYLENVADTSDGDFKYTMKTVCKAAQLDEYYQWYRLCNNFVHNNLSSVKIDPLEGKTKLVEKCTKSFKHLKKKLLQILN